MPGTVSVACPKTPLIYFAQLFRYSGVHLGMGKSLSIITNSLRLTLQELKVNKLRTALSLFGVGFGIYCIIGVLAVVNSFEQNIQNEIKTLGSNTIYIDKWEYGGGPDRPFWKYRARPVMKYSEAGLIKQLSGLMDDAAYLMRCGGNVSYGNAALNNISVYGIVESMTKIQPIFFSNGRYFSQAEFNNGSNNALIGNTIAEEMFGSPERAIGKQIEVNGKRVNVVGTIRKEGKNFISWDYDNCVMLPYNFCRTMFNEDNSNPVIIAKGKEGVTTTAFSDELKGIMRQLRRLSPTTEDNFSLNSVEAFSKSISQFFVTIDFIGAFIGLICLIIGLFGIANIMFVTVKERTAVIGLKKAIGAKRGSILFEFLMEAVLLCIIGGAIGIALIAVTLKIFSAIANFPLFIPLPLLLASLLICVVVGILAGIIPARRAAKMDPVVAIRSK
jgi:putative ABC transport system permease protein